MHRFGDVSGVVAHALDVLGAEHQVDAEGDIARVFHHIGQQLAEDRGADRVDLLVAAPDRHRLADVAAAIGIEHQLHLLEHQIGHVLDAADQLGRREFGVQRHHALGDVLGEVADAFEIVGEPQCADDFTQVDGHRLTAGDREHRLFLDLALQRVDIGVGRGDPLRQRGVALCQRIDRVRDLLLGEAAHFGDHAREILQVGVEGLRRCGRSLVSSFSHGHVSRSGR